MVGVLVLSTVAAMKCTNLVESLYRHWTYHNQYSRRPHAEERAHDKVHLVIWESGPVRTGPGSLNQWQSEYIMVG